MDKKLLFLFTLSFISISVGAKSLYNQDSLRHALNKAMEAKEYLATQKELKIEFYKQMLITSNIPSLTQRYSINKHLYDEYAKYQSDSALFYLQKNKALALQLNDSDLITEINLQIAYLYSTTGLFVESKEILDKISAKAIPPSLLSNYYETFRTYYDHYGQNNNNNTYYTKSKLYRDSLILSLTDTLSLKNKILYAEDDFFNQKKEKAEERLIHLLNTTTDEKAERALIAYLLGEISRDKGNIEEQEQYFIISAITDITNVIKNNASLQSLALTYYEKGNIDRAYRFMQSAIDDALFCNVRYRASEVLTSYPFINASYETKKVEQKEELRFYLLLISTLVIILISILIYVYKQMKKLSKTRKELYQTSVKLIDLNQEMKATNLELKKVNTQLSDVNHVKEEYIAQFFDLCSEYIDKIENYRLSLNKLASNKQLIELFQKLKSTSLIDDELENLYDKFDNIFINLYPTFVLDFNALLKEEEQIFLKQNEILNTELRIFALIRLGITDSAKIAKFLRYSLSTIYNYRTSARNKSLVPRNQFEIEIMKIGVIEKNDNPII